VFLSVAVNANVPTDLDPWVSEEGDKRGEPPWLAPPVMTDKRLDSLDHLELPSLASVGIRERDGLPMQVMVAGRVHRGGEMIGPRVKGAKHGSRSLY